MEVIGKDEAEEGSPLVRVKEKKRTDSVESRQSTSSVGSRSGGRRSLHRDRLTGEALRGEKTPSLLGYEAKYPVRHHVVLHAFLLRRSIYNGNVSSPCSHWSL